MNKNGLTLTDRLGDEKTKEHWRTVFFKVNDVGRFVCWKWSTEH